MGPHVRNVRPVRLSAVSLVCATVLLAGISARPASASGPPEPLLDATALTDLEVRAATAEPKDRCYLYSELLHDWTELAGRAMSSGDDSAAAKAIEHADADLAQLKSALANDSKRLKNAELLLEHTAHRLSDMVRVASMDQHDTMQSVLKHLNNVHDALLAQIFAH
jgi:CRISPR/Cas system CSM-associated protein Csm2 small subunit